MVKRDQYQQKQQRQQKQCYECELVCSKYVIEMNKNQYINSIQQQDQNWIKMKKKKPVIGNIVCEKLDSKTFWYQDVFLFLFWGNLIFSVLLGEPFFFPYSQG
eukprot:TRINITY_DN4507_c0_g1_i1.p5 TRINITY_DN4507_c0_g1~~TRINITY_DN4507_c0_g1_i1.p5  ORF type:complete len:103 (-),score=5.17 TRINITY_DN4507_c0_g1_i1:581-889(-)